MQTQDRTGLLVSQSKASHAIAVSLLALWLSSHGSQAQLVTGLTAVDVGTPPLAGSTTGSGAGAFSVTGSGEYKNSGTDNFHYAYTNVSGDFDYRVRVVSVEAPSQWSKAGLMVRETTDATVTSDTGSRCITMTAYPPAPTGGDTQILIRREQANSTTQDDILNTKPHYPNTWLRMRRLGDTVVGFTGTNGVSWDVQGVHDTRSWPEGALTKDLLVGLAVASAKSTATCTSQVRDFGLVPSTDPVVISSPLRALTINKGRTATFSITVGGYDPFYAVWYTNGVAVSGTVTPSFNGKLTYTTAPLTLADNNTLVNVVVSNSVNATTNGNVVLHVVDDNVAPVVTAATTENGAVDVLFNEEVSPGTATDPSNYTINGAPGIGVVGVYLSLNQRIASLILSGTIDNTNATLTVARVQDLVGNAGSQTVPLWLLLAPSNIVASGYVSDNRDTAFTSVTDTMVDNGWQTNGDKDHRPQFAGLIYTNVQTFSVVKMDLGEQNVYGGSFGVEPNLYLLRNNVDTDIAGPETDPANWEQVPAQLVSPNLFDGNVDPNPSPASPIMFDLSGLSASARSGYGWAIGGVSGDNSGFIRISELRAYGQSGGVIAPPMVTVTKASADTLVISWPANATGFVLKSATSLALPAWSPVTDPQVVVGANVTVTVGSSNQARFYRLEQ